MKYLVLTILTIASLLLVHAQEDPDVPPIPNSIRIVPLTRSVRTETELMEPLQSCETTDTGTFKCSDCRTLQYCPGGTTEADYNLTCADQNQAKPYCNENGTEYADKCTATDTCPQSEIATDFYCPGKGIFPSLTDCRNYYSCPNGIGYVAYLYRCLYNTIFNCAVQFCRLNSVCYTVAQDCGTSNKIIPYKLNNTMYVLCRGSQPAQLRVCKAGLIYNPTKLRCEFQCSSIGIFANPDNVQSFYRCFYDGRTYQLDKVDCPTGQTFDNNLKYCTA